MKVKGNAIDNYTVINPNCPEQSRIYSMWPEKRAESCLSSKYSGKEVGFNRSVFVLNKAEQFVFTDNAISKQ